MFFGSGGDPNGGRSNTTNTTGTSNTTNTTTTATTSTSTTLYSILGLSKSASPKEITTAYRTLAKQHHPDKGGDEHTFQEINAAHEVLNDPDRRAKYDLYGHDTHHTTAATTHSSSKVRTKHTTRRTLHSPDIHHPLSVSLEELYQGATIQRAIHRQVISKDAPAPTVCHVCLGDGVVLELRQIALGMVQQLQRTCQNCQGEGYNATPRVKERVVLDIKILPGMKHNEKITFRHMADETPNMEAGSIHFIVQEKNHHVFKRKGADLLVTKAVSLNEALCGFEYKLIHLDKRELIIQSNEIIHPESSFVKIVKNEGMPSHSNPFVKGDLYILFTVYFPSTLDDGTKQLLKTVLPHPASELEYDEETVEVCCLEQGNVKNFGKGGASGIGSTVPDATYDSDGAGQPPVQCQQS